MVVFLCTGALVLIPVEEEFRQGRGVGEGVAGEEGKKSPGLQSVFGG